jgi:hypothetical protein
MSPKATTMQGAIVALKLVHSAGTPLLIEKTYEKAAYLTTSTTIEYCAETHLLLKRESAVSFPLVSS